MLAKLVPFLLYLSVLMFYQLCRYALKENAIAMKNHPSLNENVKKILGFDYYYFTVWTFILQMIFVVTAISDELSNLLGLPRRIQRLLGTARAFLFHGLLLPSTMLVITMFWGLWHFDRALIFPKALDEFFPTWLNHALHTFVAVPLVVELLLPKRADFVERGKAAAALVAYFSVYTLLFLSVYFRYGVWLYPVYKILNWPQKTALFVIQMLSVLAFQKIGISIKNSRRLATNHSHKVK